MPGQSEGWKRREFVDAEEGEGRRKAVERQAQHLGSVFDPENSGVNTERELVPVEGGAEGDEVRTEVGRSCARQGPEVSGIDSSSALRTNIGKRRRDARLGTSRRVIESCRTVEVEREIATQQAREDYRGATRSQVLRCSAFEASCDVQDLQN